MSKKLCFLDINSKEAFHADCVRPESLLSFNLKKARQPKLPGILIILILI